MKQITMLLQYDKSLSRKVKEQKIEEMYEQRENTFKSISESVENELKLFEGK